MITLQINFVTYSPIHLSMTMLIFNCTVMSGCGPFWGKGCCSLADLMVLDYMTYLLSLIYCLYYSIILLSLFWKLHLPWFLTLSLICEANNSALLMMRGIISRTRIASWSPFKKLFLLSMIEEQYSLCFQQVIDLSHKCRTWFFVCLLTPPVHEVISHERL